MPPQFRAVAGYKVKTAALAAFRLPATPWVLAIADAEMDVQDHVFERVARPNPLARKFPLLDSQPYIRAGATALSACEPSDY